MMIVVAIMMILVAAAATQFRPANDSRRVREAARAINVYLSSARNRAMETGRPCGVMLRQAGTLTTSALSHAVMELDQVEVPPTYSGDIESSYATVTNIGGGSLTAVLSDGAPTNLVSPLDQIQFNYQGPYFFVGPAAVNPVDSNFCVTSGTLTLVSDSTQPPAAIPLWSSVKMPYRIYRRPIKGAAQPVQLPATTVIDLDYSGFGSGSETPTSFGNPQDVIIIFAPNGSVFQVYCNGAINQVAKPIFLLVGKRERVNIPFVLNNTDPSTMANCQDLTNLWVVINPQTGLVTTGEVAAAATATDLPSTITQSRALARDAQSMGGK
jgi:type II secretory pathway pseudopilin PulG